MRKSCPNHLYPCVALLRRISQPADNPPKPWRRRVFSWMYHGLARGAPCRGGVYPRPRAVAVRFCSHAMQREEAMSEIASNIWENPVRLFVGKDTSKINRVWIRCLAQLAGILRAGVNPAPTLIYSPSPECPVRKHGDEWQDDPPKPWRRRVTSFGEFRHLIKILRCPALWAGSFTGGSSSGRTTGSGPVNRGSNPRPPAIVKLGGPIV